MTFMAKPIPPHQQPANPGLLLRNQKEQAAWVRRHEGKQAGRQRVLIILAAAPHPRLKLPFGLRCRRFLACCPRWAGGWNGRIDRNKQNTPQNLSWNLEGTWHILYISNENHSEKLEKHITCSGFKPIFLSKRTIVGTIHNKYLYNVVQTYIKVGGERRRKEKSFCKYTLALA
jgi:hypothetical protein